jgi:hypothetical protein|nr:hypothetical protein [Hymenobacter wooponensis]
MDTLAAIPSQRGEEAQDRPSGWGGRIDAWVQSDEADLPGVQSGHHLRDVGAVAAQPVQAG